MHSRVKNSLLSPKVFNLNRRSVLTGRIGVTALSLASLALLGVWGELATSARGATILSSDFGPVSTGPATGMGSFTGKSDPGVMAPIASSSFQPPSPRPAPQPQESSRSNEHSERHQHSKLDGHNDSSPTPTLSPAPAPPTPIVTTAPGPVWSANMGWGWYNKLYFRGLDLLKGSSPTNANGGVVNTNLQLGLAREKDSFSVAFSYYEALARQVTAGAANDQFPNNKDQAKGRKQENFHLPPDERYAELDIYLTYTRNLGKSIRASVGFNHYHFSDGRFFGTESPISYANESVLRLDYTALPYVTPSIKWAHDFDGFIGNYFELRLDSSFELKKDRVSIKPYIAASYDKKYNGTNDGWNSLEFGANLPIRLTDQITLSFTGNYVKSLDDTLDSKGDIGRTVGGFWGGVSLSAAWGGLVNPVKDKPLSDLELKNIVPVVANDKKWEVSAGTGWRNIDTDFHNVSVTPFDTSRVYAHKQSVADPGFADAQNSKTYEDGAVYSNTAKPVQSPAGGDPAGKTGLANFRYNSPSQVLGDPANGTGQIRFSTSSYRYDAHRDTHDISQRDQDSIVFPYVKVDREIWRNEQGNGRTSLRAGFLYSYSTAQTDSGVQLARVDSLIEHKDSHGRIYAVDAIGTEGVNLKSAKNFNSNNLKTGFAAVVFNAADYVKYYDPLLDPTSKYNLGQAKPQKDTISTDVEVARVTTFIKSKLDVTANDLALPISLRHDFGRRFHTELSAAVTLTFVNSDFSTDIRRNGEDNLRKDGSATGKAQSNLIGGVSRGDSPLGDNIDPNFFTSKTYKASTTSGIDKGAGNNGAENTGGDQPTGNNRTKSGGKGAALNLDDPTAPGRSLSHDRYERSSLDILLGASASASVLWDLNEAGTTYAEFWGRYHWINDVTVSNQVSSSTIHLSGFDAGVGIGFRF